MKTHIRMIAIGTTPRIRRYYRRCRRFGWDRDTAMAMTYGAIEFSGEGKLLFQPTVDELGRILRPHPKTVGDAVRQMNKVKR